MAIGAEELKPLWSAGHDPDAPPLVRQARALSAFGLPIDAVWIPERARRGGLPTADRPSFAAHKGERIRAREMLVQDEDVIITPNKFRFFERHLCVWPRSSRTREHPPELLARGFELAGAIGGSALANVIGSSASIQLAHLHLVDSASEALATLPMETVHELRASTVLAPDPEFPLWVVAVDAADVNERAAVVRDLLDARTTAAVNVLGQGQRVWLFPRRLEVPAPWFPYALGAAELWGRFVFQTRESLEAVTEADLERALEAACVANSTAEREGLAAVFAGF